MNPDRDDGLESSIAPVHLLALRQKHLNELNENFRLVSRLYITW